jgi:PAS domain S-box-containing protein
MQATMPKSVNPKPSTLQAELEALRAQSQARQQQYEESENRYHVLFDAALEGLLVHEQGQVLEVNPAFLRLFGMSYDELIGQSIMPLVAPEHHEIVRQAMQSDRQTPYEVDAIRKDGSRFLAEVIGKSYLYQGRMVRISAVRDISYRRETERIQAEQQAFLEALQESSRLLNSTLDPEALMRRILETLERVIQHDTANIMLIEGAGLVVRAKYWRGYSPQQADQLAQMAVPLQEFRTFRTMIQTGQPIAIPDVAHDPQWAKGELDNVVRSFASAPIILDGEVIGFLNVDSQRPNSLTQVHAERLKAFADHAAIALQNANLFAATRQQAEALQKEIIVRAQAEQALERRNQINEILNQISNDALAYLDEGHVMTTIARLSAQAVGGTSAYVSRLNPDTMQVTVLADYLSDQTSAAEQESDTGATYQLYEQFGLDYDWLTSFNGYQITRIDDPATPPRYRDYIQRFGGYTTLISTIWGEGRPIGTIEVWDSRPGRRFNAEDAEVMLAVARQASLTLTKARLVSALQESEARNRALINALPDNIFRLRRDGTFLDAKVNDTSGLDIKAELLIGRNIAKRLPPHIVQAAMEQIEKALQTGHIQFFDYDLDIEGHIYTYEVRVMPSGPDEVVSIIRDVTEHRRYEQALARRNKLLETLNDLSRESLLRLEEGHILTSLARLACQAIDGTSAYVCDWDEINQTYGVLAEYISPQANAKEQQSDLGQRYPLVDSGTGERIDWIYAPQGYLLTHANAEQLSPRLRQHYADYSANSCLLVPLWVEQQPIGFIEIWDSRPQRYITQADADSIIAVARQVSLTLAKARLDQALRQSEAQKSAMLDALPDLMFRMNTEGVYLDAKVFPNSPFQPDDLIHKRIQDFLPAQVSIPTLDYIRRVVQTGQMEVYEYQLPEPDGRMHDYESRMVRCGDDEALCVVRDITERKRYEQDLAAARDAALEASRTKSQFLANMSHELRTPLNSIINYTQLLLDGIYGDITRIQADRMEKVTRNARNLLTLINDVLDLSKIEAGHMILKRRRVDSRDFIQTILEVFKPLAEEKNLWLRYLATPTPDLYIDEIRARQVLTNLIGNAIKFTHTGGVSLQTEVQGDFLRLSVIDTGIGIPPDALQKIFEEFRQADNSSTRAYEGTGLGLTISKRLVEMHGGSISVESAVGQGSAFHITFPLARPDQTE